MPTRICRAKLCQLCRKLLQLALLQLYVPAIAVMILTRFAQIATLLALATIMAPVLPLEAAVAVQDIKATTATPVRPITIIIQTASVCPLPALL